MNEASEGWVWFAPAKVNLTLHVVGRREDGYHLLDSLVVFAGIGDSLSFAPAEDLSLTLDGPNAVRLEGENIVLRAAHLLADWAGIVPRAAIRLTKRLPVAAGIGGGSADGAATLRGLADLWSLTPSEEDLARLGAKLGADLPVCLRGTPTRLQGIGDKLDPVPALPPAWLVLVNPGIALSTPAVFKARTGGFSCPAPLEQAPRDAAHLAELLRQRTNDLFEAACSLVPEAGEVVAALAATPACLLARMSGSGATGFGLYAEQAEAEAAAQSLRATHPGWWVAAAPLLTKNPSKPLP